ncbi:CPBP family intramembrane glutamic endopeptidase [Psychrobacillus psychrodurans]|uniref:CPBP family intramembrane metalloprotease n=1 Tax=Psychrobacillus psychrodurans TaxID=126157 RepID=A0A9X3LAQ1_9BACI|nr:CPBP family intramembrane glutamic endopeptidase [Psychrobacillus psychrodurans]MCZ8534563.1 CPBP family intramembrane metalloprotease [Psychrobacillus psychrodurans]
MPAGILLSSSVFMLMHIPTYNTLPINFLTGVIFSWTYEKTGSIYPGIYTASLLALL